jgi:hypothetical protein
MIKTRDNKIRKLYGKLSRSKFKMTVRKQNAIIQEQSKYIERLKDEIERMGGDWHHLVDTSGRLERRKKYTRRGNRRESHEDLTAI